MTNDFYAKYPRLQLVENFRDLGGTVLCDGKKVKDNRLFRCGNLNGLTTDALDALKNLNLGRIVDFRSCAEAEATPDCVLENVKNLHASVLAEDSFSLLKRSDFDIKKIVSSMTEETFSFYAKSFVESYKEMPFAKQAYLNVFEGMDNDENVLFHCSAGKDRTGVCSMLILLALGADYQTIENDYLLTNVYRKKLVEKISAVLTAHHLPPKVVEMTLYICQAQKEFIKSSYDAIFSKYRTAEEFFADVYGIDESRLARYRVFYTE